MDGANGRSTSPCTRSTEPSGSTFRTPARPNGRRDPFDRQSRGVNGWTLAGTSFLASAVEAVEALTIVLAVGITRSWPVALRGAAFALLALALIVALFGPLLRFVPIDQLKLVVGVVLTLFGFSWLESDLAVRRPEGASRRGCRVRARGLGAPRGREAQPTGSVVTAFNAVLIEGLEVAIIVVTFGAASTAALGWSAAGAVAAVLLVVALGVALKAPASRVPENTMKFAVGVMLTSFGTFWTGEGLGIAWWGADPAAGLAASISRSRPSGRRGARRRARRA